MFAKSNGIELAYDSFGDPAAQPLLLIMGLGTQMSLIPFPTRELFEEQLPSFDVIVLQNFEFMPYGIGDYLDNIRSYVEGGGGLAMLGGDMSFSSGGYHGTPVAAALPVELADPWGQGDLISTLRRMSAATSRRRSPSVL